MPLFVLLCGQFMIYYQSFFWHLEIPVLPKWISGKPQYFMDLSTCRIIKQHQVMDLIAHLFIFLSTWWEKAGAGVKVGTAGVCSQILSAQKGAKFIKFQQAKRLNSSNFSGKRGWIPHILISFIPQTTQAGVWSSSERPLLGAAWAVTVAGTNCGTSGTSL